MDRAQGKDHTMIDRVINPCHSITLVIFNRIPEIRLITLVTRGVITLWIFFLFLMPVIIKPRPRLSLALPITTVARLVTIPNSLVMPMMA